VLPTGETEKMHGKQKTRKGNTDYIILYSLFNLSTAIYYSIVYYILSKGRRKKTEEEKKKRPYSWKKFFVIITNLNQ